LGEITVVYSFDNNPETVCLSTTCGEIGSQCIESSLQRKVTVTIRTERAGNCIWNIGIESGSAAGSYPI
jgi:hypothetical protein